MDNKRVSNRKKNYFTRKSELFIARFKELQGDPHYIAIGMAVGVYVGITPTMPFHTALAIALAFAFKGSKPAAIIGVWICNPVTVLFFYMASYKAGMLMFGGGPQDGQMIAEFIEVLESPVPLADKWSAVLHFVKNESHAFYAMIMGGFIIALPPAIASYFITKKFASRLKK